MAEISVPVWFFWFIGILFALSAVREFFSMRRDDAMRDLFRMYFDASAPRDPQGLNVWAVLRRVAPKARFSDLDEALMAQGWAIDMRAKPDPDVPVNNFPKKDDRLSVGNDPEATRVT